MAFFRFKMYSIRGDDGDDLYPSELPLLVVMRRM